MRLSRYWCDSKISGCYIRKTCATELPKSLEIVKIVKIIKNIIFNDQNIKHDMLLIFMEILQLDCYAVPELPKSGIPYKTV